MVQNRRADLDWIRILATYVVFLFHCSMFFNPFPWHVKNEIINSSYILVFSLLVGTWIMPIFFALSGISTYFALTRRTGKVFLKERIVKLGVPLLFGILILSPPQVYIERLSHQQFSGSFLSFLPKYFDGLYLEIGGTGNFAFVGLHLWYLFVLFLFSAITLPLLTRKRNNVKSFKLNHYAVILVILVVIARYFNFVNLGGWGIPYYFALFLFGYYFFSNESFKEFLMMNKNTIAILAVSMTGIYITWFMLGIPKMTELTFFLFTIVKVVSSLNSMLFIFYLANRFLTQENNFFNYNSALSMPFYVLHQPVIVMVGFLIYQLDWPIAVKLVFLITTSLSMILFSYEFFIKKITVLRVLFGMKGKKPSKIELDKALKG
jgi:glucans biosynthesis protein C